jgi:hypothetical protein
MLIDEDEIVQWLRLLLRRRRLVGGLDLVSSCRAWAYADLDTRSICQVGPVY